MMAAAFFAFLASMVFAWRKSTAWALGMFFTALALSAGIFVSHIDTVLNLQF